MAVVFFARFEVLAVVVAQAEFPVMPLGVSEG